MGIKAKICRAGAAVAQVVTLGPLAAITIPAADAALSHTEEWYDKKQKDDKKNSKK